MGICSSKNIDPSDGGSGRKFSSGPFPLPGQGHTSQTHPSSSLHIQLPQPTISQQQQQPPHAHLPQSSLKASPKSSTKKKGDTTPGSHGGGPVSSPTQIDVAAHFTPLLLPPLPSEDAPAEGDANGALPPSSPSSPVPLSAPPLTWVEVNPSHCHYTSHLHTEAVTDIILAPLPLPSNSASAAAPNAQRQSNGSNSNAQPCVTISCSADKSICMYDWKEKNVSDKFNNHSKAVTCLAAAPAVPVPCPFLSVGLPPPSSVPPVTLFSASRDTTIRQWKSHVFKELASFRGHTLPVSSLLVYPAPFGSASASSAAAAPSPSPSSSFSSTPSSSFSLSSSPRLPLHLISGGRDYSLRVFDVETGAQLAMRTLPKNVVTCMRWIAPQQTRELGAQLSGMMNAQMSEVAVASVAEVMNSEGGGAAVSGVQSQTRVAGNDSQLEADCHSATHSTTLYNGGGGAGMHPAPGSSIDLSSSSSQTPPYIGAGFDAHCFLQGSEDAHNAIRIWDARTLEVVATFPSASASSSTPSSLLKYPTDLMADPNDSRFFVSVSSALAPGLDLHSAAANLPAGVRERVGGEIKLWDRRMASSNTGLGDSRVQPLLTILAHADSIHAVTYLPVANNSRGGQQSVFVATASKDKTLKVWDLSPSASSDSTSLPGSGSRCRQVLSFRDSKFASEFTALVADPTASSLSSSNNSKGGVLYAGSGNGMLSAWQWNPNNAQLHLQALVRQWATGQMGSCDAEDAERAVI